MRILALTKYGTLAAGTRQRFLQYYPALKAEGIELEWSPLFGNDYLARIMAAKRAPISIISAAYFRRIKTIITSSDADVVWLHCEFFPYWPSFSELLSAHMIGKPIVYDFDDAIFHMYDENARLPVRMLIGNKLEPLLRRVTACTCGNSYLLDYAARFCSRSIVLPTVVDTTVYRPLGKAHAGPLTIGWIGSPSTWRGVRPLLPLLEKICDRHGARFLAVGPGPLALADRFAGMELRDWSESREVADVQEMDIGIMPLLDRPFERGKSGFKLVQYMGCGLPVIASPIGVNTEIVKQDANGFLASTNQEWEDALDLLLTSPDRRVALGRAGRARAVQSYSLSSQAPTLINLFKSLA